MRFQREVAGIDEPDDRIGNVALERLGTGRQEERIVLSPHSQERRLVSPEVLLKGRVERDVALSRLAPSGVYTGRTEEDYDGRHDEARVSGTG